MEKRTTVSDLDVALKLTQLYHSARDRKLEFNLTYKTVKRLITNKTCFYTGVEFQPEGPLSRSIDRIDTTQGYIEGNVVACTVDINGKKANLTIPEIGLLFKSITKHNKKKK
jgi:hypothetical protein